MMMSHFILTRWVMQSYGVDESPSLTIALWRQAKQIFDSSIRSFDASWWSAVAGWKMMKMQSLLLWSLATVLLACLAAYIIWLNMLLLFLWHMVFFRCCSTFSNISLGLFFLATNIYLGRIFLWLSNLDRPFIANLDLEWMSQGCVILKCSERGFVIHGSTYFITLSERFGI